MNFLNKFKSLFVKQDKLPENQPLKLNIGMAFTESEEERNVCREYIEDVKTRLNDDKNTRNLLKNPENTSFSEDEQIFVNKVMEKIDTEYLSIDRLKDGTLNFCYKDCQIGRIKFGKKSSSMQLLTAGNVDWLHNKAMQEYVDNVDIWADYTKGIEGGLEE